MVPVAGVDACPGGWCVVTEDNASVRSYFSEVLDALPADAFVAVDMPIGLLDQFVEKGRQADHEARNRLKGKASSVFSAPPRPVLRYPDDYDAANSAVDGHLPKQTFALVKKLIEVEEVVLVLGQEQVYEVHPELSFWGMNGETPVLSNKHTPEGEAERRQLLRGADIAIPGGPPRGAKRDDLLDACAALWSARRIVAGTGQRVPEHPPVDSRGLRMEICW